MTSTSSWPFDALLPAGPACCLRSMFSSYSLRSVSIVLPIKSNRFKEMVSGSGEGALFFRFLPLASSGSSNSGSIFPRNSANSSNAFARSIRLCFSRSASSCRLIFALVLRSTKLEPKGLVLPDCTFELLSLV
jgi:hypothetical protein